MTRYGLKCLLLASGALAATTLAAEAQVSKKLNAPAAITAAQAQQMVGNARPMQRTLKALPKETFRGSVVSNAAPALPGVTASYAGSDPVAKAAAQSESTADIGAQNYGNDPFGSGGSNLNTIYHYNDYRLNQAAVLQIPYRYTGHFYFTTPQGQSRCSATMISKSILLTAGHCVHAGGTGNAGWYTDGIFIPSVLDQARYGGKLGPYGYALADSMYTTGGWFNSGQLDQGYDVALVVLGKRQGGPTIREMGLAVGYNGYCFQNCLQPYWQLSQFGFPGNYDNGSKMQVGEHIEKSNTRDYLHGSGMQGGSSGGPHISNPGALVDSTATKGNYTTRNVVFAVTSWGFVSDQFKIQGASPLSGPNNSNNFKGMWNLACTRARALHGTGSCGLFP